MNSCFTNTLGVIREESPSILINETQSFPWETAAAFRARTGVTGLLNYTFVFPSWQERRSKIIVQVIDRHISWERLLQKQSWMNPNPETETQQRNPSWWESFSPSNSRDIQQERGNPWSTVTVVFLTDLFVLKLAVSFFTDFLTPLVSWMRLWSKIKIEIQEKPQEHPHQERLESCITSDLLVHHLCMMPSFSHAVS